MPLVAIEEHWIMPDVTSALRAVPRSDESLAFNEMGDNRQRLEDLAAGRIAAMEAPGIDLSTDAEREQFSWANAASLFGIDL